MTTAGTGVALSTSTSTAILHSFAVVHSSHERKSHRHFLRLPCKPTMLFEMLCSEGTSYQAALTASKRGHGRTVGDMADTSPTHFALVLCSRNRKSSPSSLRVHQVKKMDQVSHGTNQNEFGGPSLRSIW